MNKKLISEYLIKLRKDQGYTQNDLAQELFVTRQAISRWENENAIPDLEILLKLSKLYHVTFNNILEPKITNGNIQDFEKIPSVSTDFLLDVFHTFSMEDIVKALMGASPDVNKFVQQLYPNIDFSKIRSDIGSVRIDEIESLQNQIMAYINISECLGELV